MSTTDYLSTLNWGTSTGGAAGSAETTLTLGQDPLDTRIPPDQYRLSLLQIARIKNLVLSMSQFAKGGTRLQVLAQSSNPFGAGEAGYWTDNSNNPKFTAANGTVTTLGAGGGSLTNTATKTTNYSAVVGDRVLVDPTGGAFAVTLPTAVGNSSLVIAVKNVSASTNAVTVGTTAAQTIDGAATFVINLGYQGVEFVSDGANWMVF